MPNPNPYQARQAIKRQAQASKSPVNLDELRQLMSDFLETLHAHIGSPDEPAPLNKLKDVGYLFIQAVGTYVKLTEAGELEARYESLKRELDDLKASRLAA